MTTITPKAYAQLLVDHDWFYGFSDSNSVYQRGEARVVQLELIADAHPKLEAMYDAAKKRIRDIMKDSKTPMLTVEYLKVVWDGFETPIDVK